MKMRVGFCRNVARKILKEMNIVSPPVDIRNILERRGFIYLEVENFSKDIEAMLIEHDGEKYAAVNKSHHETKKRFSLAHELGHMELNHSLTCYTEIPTIDNPPDSSYFSHKTALKKLEQEANEFAAELLVPLSMLKKEFIKNNDVDYLVKTFNVSRSVILITLQKHMKSFYGSKDDNYLYFN